MVHQYPQYPSMEHFSSFRRQRFIDDHPEKFMFERITILPLQYHTGAYASLDACRKIRVELAEHVGIDLRREHGEEFPQCLHMCGARAKSGKYRVLHLVGNALAVKR